MGKLLTSRIFIKSAIGQTSLKLGVMITWVNSIILKTFIAIATCLEGTDYSNSWPNQIKATHL